MSDAHHEEIRKLEELYAQHPEGRIFTHLAEAYRKAGQLEEARTVLDEGIQRHPDYSSAHVVRGRVLMDQGDAAEAEAEFRRVLELDSHNMVALRSLGDLARGDGRSAEALRHYHRLLEVEPAAEDVRQLIGEIESGAPVAEPGPEPTAGEPRDEPAEETAAEPWSQGVEPEEPAEAPDELVAGSGFEDAAWSLSEEPGEPGEPAESGVAGEYPEAADLEAFRGDEEGAPPAEPAADIPGLDEPAGGEPPMAPAGPLSPEYELDPGPEGDPGPPDDADLDGVDRVEGLERAEGGGSDPLEGVESGEPVEAVEGLEGPEGSQGLEGVEGEPDLAAYEESAEWIQPAEEEASGFGTGDFGVRDVGDDESQEARFDDEPESPLGAEAGGDEPVRTWDLDEEPERGSGAGADDGGEEETPMHGTPGVMTETIARVYARQGLYDRAAEVYRELVRERPHEAALRERLAEMEDLAERAEDMPSELAGADATPLEGLESHDVDPETRLTDTTAGAGAGVETPAEMDVRDVPPPPEEDPWAAGAGGGAEPEEGSVWTDADWGEAETESPYAWGEPDPEEDADETPPIESYIRGLLGWGGGRGTAGRGEAGGGAAVEETTPAASAEETAPGGSAGGASGAVSSSEESAMETDGHGAGSPEDDDDDDLEMFRSWLESLKR